MEKTQSLCFRSQRGVLVLGIAFHCMVGFSSAQTLSSIPFSEDDSLSYLIILADTNQVPIYIDQVLMGYSPLKQPIPVPSGFHTVSFLPGSVQNIYRERLWEVVKQVYMAPADTQTIFLETGTYRQELLRWRTDHQRSTAIGLTMGILTLILIWIAAL